MIGINRTEAEAQSKIKYYLTDSEVLELYYSEPRLAALMDIDVIRLIDNHLVVNLRDWTYVNTLDTKS